jgi:hypothetical protein
VTYHLKLTDGTVDSENMPINVQDYEGKKVRAKIKTPMADTTVVGVLKMTIGGATIGAVNVSNVINIASIEVVK